MPYRQRKGFRADRPDRHHSAWLLVTHRDNPIKDVAALVAAAKANPDKLSLAPLGVATISHFAGELFKSSAGIKMVHLPYRGSAPR